MTPFEEKKWEADYEKDGLRLDVEMELGDSYPVATGS